MNGNMLNVGPASSYPLSVRVAEVIAKNDRAFTRPTVFVCCPAFYEVNCNTFQHVGATQNINTIYMAIAREAGHKDDRALYMCRPR